MLNKIDLKKQKKTASFFVKSFDIIFFRFYNVRILTILIKKGKSRFFDLRGKNGRISFNGRI